MRGAVPFLAVLFVVPLLAGCLGEEEAGVEPSPDPEEEMQRMEPRVYRDHEPGVGLAFAAGAVNATSASFVREYQTSDVVVGAASGGAPVGRERVDDLIPPDMPVWLHLEDTEDPGTNFVLEHDRGRVYERIIGYAEGRWSWLLSRAPDEEVRVAVYKRPHPMGDVGVPFMRYGFDLRVTPAADPLAAGVPVMTFVDPKVPIGLDVQDEGVDGLVLVNPGGDVAARLPVGDLRLPSDLSPDRYVLMLTGEGAANLTGGFSGVARALGTEPVIGDSTRVESGDVSWSDEVPEAPWRVGYQVTLESPIIDWDSEFKILYDQEVVYVEKVDGFISLGVGSYTVPGPLLSREPLGSGTYGFQFQTGAGMREYATVYWRFVTDQP